MIRIQTKAYGPLEVDERQILHFPEGLLGFEKFKDYALLDAAQKPFFYLQSMDISELAFVLIPAGKPSTTCWLSWRPGRNSMLILSRRLGERIVIGDDVVISVVEVRGDQVKLGIEAPKNVKVYRQEVFDSIQQENLRAAESPLDLPDLGL